MRISVLAFCTALFFLILAHYAQASSLKEKIKENRNLLQKANFQEKYILKELNDIAKQIENLSLAITEIQNKIKNTKENLTRIHIKIEKLKQKEQQLKNNISKEIGILITISKTTWMNLLFNPQDINDFLRREDYLYAIIQSEANKLLEIKKTKQQLKSLEEKLKKEFIELENSKEKYKEKEKELKLLKQEKETLLTEIRQNKKLYKETLSILLAAQKELEKLTQEISRTRKIKRTSSEEPSKGISLRPLFEVKGFLYPPVEGRVLRFFGLDRDLFTGKLSFSPGIFIGAPPGSKVVAPFSAKVVKVRWIKSQGEVVVLDHGYDFTSIIGGLGETKVFPGQEVRTGELLGTVGASPYGPSGVYYELRYGQKPQNPLEWLNLKKLKILR